MEEKPRFVCEESWRYQQTFWSGLFCHALHAMSLATTATQSSHQDTSLPDMLTVSIQNVNTCWQRTLPHERQIFGVKWYDHLKNSDIAGTTSLPNVNDSTAKRRLALFGHMVRLDTNTPAHQILKQAVDVKSGHRPNARWRRPPGRPRNSWLQQINNGSLTSIRQSWRAAEDRGHRGSPLRASATYSLRWWWWWSGKRPLKWMCRV